MKRTLFFLLSVLVLLNSTVTALADNYSDYLSYDEDYVHPLTGEYINVYNWGEYISDGSEGSLDINKEFTRITGIKVNYTNYASNEDMYAKLKSGGASYDVIFPSDYMVQRLINEDMLEKLDLSNIPNYKYIAEEYRNLPYDPKNEYSVPYTVGMVGLIYNSAMIERMGYEEPTSWNALWDHRYSGSILMFNNPRDAFAISQFLLGIDLNTTDPEDWKKAYDKLLEQKPFVQSYVMDEIFNKMENNEAILAPYYVGDFLSMKDNNDDLEFVYPEEGVNYFVDAMCVPKGARNKEAAELYINFMLDPEIALQNAEYIYYASPHSEVINNPEYSLYENEYIYPSDSVKNQIFTDLPRETNHLMTDYWDSLKVDGYDYTLYYIGFISFLLFIIGLTIYRNHKKKKYDYD
ncbi:MAG: spermidine/putrescine ABC transporter substrate-binding protein [Ruminococcaceae bacterium]|nr:spermidine/putrescine ABC transporter substrate-binding protein [Oscillospiraceae bacterium]